MLGDDTKYCNFGANVTVGFLRNFSFVILFFLSISARAQTKIPSPKVLFLAFPEWTTDGDELFRAIRAQLSAAPLTIVRSSPAVSAGLVPKTYQPTMVARLAQENGADVVFWIENADLCRIFFYVSDPAGGQIVERILILESSTTSSRLEVIAIAAAAMVEALLVGSPPDKKPTSVSPPVPPLPPAPKAPAKREAIEPNRRGEIFADYVGIYFAKDTFGHGVQLGLGFFPISRLALSASFCQVFPMTVQDELLTLEITERMVDISAAFRLLKKPMDIRIGAAWTVDLRGASAASKSDVLNREPDSFKAVYSISPFISADWVFGRLGLFAKVGANIAVNDTVYNFAIDDVHTLVLSPFVAKLTVAFGLSLQI